MNEQHTLINAVLPPSTITFSISRPEPNTTVMEITKDGIWVNPDVSVDDTAKAVLDALDVYINKLVKEVVHQEREACAKLLIEMTDLSALRDDPMTQNFVATLLVYLTDLIRARGEK